MSRLGRRRSSFAGCRRERGPPTSKNKNWYLQRVDAAAVKQGSSFLFCFSSTAAAARDRWGLLAISRHFAVCRPDSFPFAPLLCFSLPLALPPWSTSAQTPLPPTPPHPTPYTHTRTTFPLATHKAFPSLLVAPPPPNNSSFLCSLPLSSSSPPFFFLWHCAASCAVSSAHAHTSTPAHAETPTDVPSVEAIQPCARHRCIGACCCFSLQC